jgi:hypothetical protein
LRLPVFPPQGERYLTIHPRGYATQRHFRHIYKRIVSRISITGIESDVRIAMAFKVCSMLYSRRVEYCTTISINSNSELRSG